MYSRRYAGLPADTGLCNQCLLQCITPGSADVSFQFWKLTLSPSGYAAANETLIEPRPSARQDVWQSLTLLGFTFPLKRRTEGGNWNGNGNGVSTIVNPRMQFHCQVKKITKRTWERICLIQYSGQLFDLLGKGCPALHAVYGAFTTWIYSATTRIYGSQWFTVPRV